MDEGKKGGASAEKRFGAFLLDVDVDVDDTDGGGEEARDGVGEGEGDAVAEIAAVGLVATR